MESAKRSEQDSNAMELRQQRGKRLPARFVLVLKAYLCLIRFNVYLARKDFASLYSKVRDYRLRKCGVSPSSVEEICSAVDMACIWYCKQVLCLQRSAVTVCLLRNYGIPALLVLGVQQMPFKAHSWVEVDGKVVNDRHYMGELYATLDRC